MIFLFVRESPSAPLLAPLGLAPWHAHLYSTIHLYYRHLYSYYSIYMPTIRCIPDIIIAILLYYGVNCKPRI